MALILMLVAIVLPTAKYSLYLATPTAAELLAAVCLGLFSAVVFLWILDVTSLIEFRSPWVGKAIFTAAISSVLGTTVAVYKDSFAGPRHPLEGKWYVDVSQEKSGTLFQTLPLSLLYSERNDSYWGFSRVDAAQRNPPGTSPSVLAVEVRELKTGELDALFAFTLSDGSTVAVKQSFDLNKNVFSFRPRASGRKEWQVIRLVREN